MSNKFKFKNNIHVQIICAIVRIGNTVLDLEKSFPIQKLKIYGELQFYNF